MATQENTQEFSMSAVDKSTAFIEKNKKIFIGVIAAIIIVVGGIYAYQTLVVKPNEEKASYLLSKGQDYFALGNFDLALNGDKTDFTGFVNIAKKYSSTKAGNLANLYAGLSYAQKGDAKNAIKYLEEFSSKGDQMISPAALAALGNCYAKDGNVDKAISLLKEAAAKADNNSLSPVFLLQAGTLLESQKKTEEAHKLYLEIKEKYPASAISQNINKYIERATK